MVKWVCRCGYTFQSPETFVTECPNCGEILYSLFTCGNFAGFSCKTDDEKND